MPNSFGPRRRRPKEMLPASLEWPKPEKKVVGFGTSGRALPENGYQPNAAKAGKRPGPQQYQPQLPGPSGGLKYRLPEYPIRQRPGEAAPALPRKEFARGLDPRLEFWAANDVAPCANDPRSIGRAHVPGAAFAASGQGRFAYSKSDKLLAVRAKKEQRAYRRRLRGERREQQAAERAARRAARGQCVWGREERGKWSRGASAGVDSPGPHIDVRASLDRLAGGSPEARQARARNAAGRVGSREGGLFAAAPRARFLCGGSSIDKLGHGALLASDIVVGSSTPPPDAYDLDGAERALRGSTAPRFSGAPFSSSASSIVDDGADFPEPPRTASPGLPELGSAFSASVASLDGDELPGRRRVDALLARLQAHIRASFLSFEDAFAQIDANGDRRIQENEFVDWVATLRADLAPAEARELVRGMDRDGSGDVDWREFRAALVKANRRARTSRRRRQLASRGFDGRHARVKLHERKESWHDDQVQAMRANIWHRIRGGR